MREEILHTKDATFCYIMEIVDDLHNGSGEFLFAASREEGVTKNILRTAQTIAKSRHHASILRYASSLLPQIRSSDAF